MKHKLKFEYIGNEACVFYSCKKCRVSRLMIDLKHPETIEYVINKDDCKPFCDVAHHWKYDGFTACNTGDYITLGCKRCDRKAQISIDRLINSKYCEES